MASSFLTGSTVGGKLIVTETISITYSNLKTLRDNSKLVPGQQYRITDYNTTVTGDNYTVGIHQFDIIVVADDVNVLNENARAIQNSSDTYFVDSKLETWELKYCLDNDTDRFEWANTTNGKGVIYWMRDEFNNECPYDFKSIMFKRWKATDNTDTGILVDLDGSYCIADLENLPTGLICEDETDFIWAYTFAAYDERNNNTVDKSLCEIIGGVAPAYGNIIKEYHREETQGDFHIQRLNNITIIDNDGLDIDDMQGNTFGVDCYNISAWGYYFRSNTFGNSCHSNTFGNSCHSNTFGNSCRSNTFGIGCNSNTFGNSCHSNTFGNDYNLNTFGNGCYSNTFGNGCYSNTFGNGCHHNTFGDECNFNTFGNSCHHNTFGDECNFNTFGNSCHHNIFASNSNGTAGNYFYYNKLENGVSYCTLYNTQTASGSQLVKNYIIKSSITSPFMILRLVDRNLAYDTTIAMKSNGKIVQYCEADLIADQD